MRELDIVYRTMFAELEQRSLAWAPRSDFPIQGWFVTVPVKGREYLYFETVQEGSAKRTYVGPKDDPEIARRAAAFKEMRDDLKSRRSLVSTLVRQARLNAPERFTGDVVAALSKAGLFRPSGVLVGTAAYQSYAGPLGVRLPATAMQASDTDRVQFHSVSAAVGESLPAVLEVIRMVDRTFREVPHQTDNGRATVFENAAGFKVEFLTPDRDDAAQPATMPASGGTSDEPLRLLDFLIRDPIRSVLLHQSGVPILIPAPERYAIHKLIVASRRKSDGNGTAKRAKDVMQAGSIAEAMIATRRQTDLAVAFAEARGNGPHWREALRIGFSYLRPDEANRLREALSEGLDSIGEDADPSDIFEEKATASAATLGSRSR